MKEKHWNGNGFGLTLGQMVVVTPISAWSNPCTVDAAGGNRYSPGQTHVCHEAKKAARMRGPTTNSSILLTAKYGVLNPALSRWLMGYPPELDGQSPGWASYQLMQALQRGLLSSPELIALAVSEATAMPSSHKSLPCS